MCKLKLTYHDGSAGTLIGWPAQWNDSWAMVEPIVPVLGTPKKNDHFGSIHQKFKDVRMDWCLLIQDQIHGVLELKNLGAEACPITFNREMAAEAAKIFSDFADGNPDA